MQGGGAELVYTGYAQPQEQYFIITTKLPINIDRQPCPRTKCEPCVRMLVGFGSGALN